MEEKGEGKKGEREWVKGFSPVAARGWVGVTSKGWVVADRGCWHRCWRQQPG